ncbi:MAG: DNA primase DnaG [Candidatus Thermoplasmatota archaeon]|jgi:DNA primase|nr:DNA primase DnaG [Candidatus Thermoplasmatota archaeon]MCL5799985.1 DNA primase DnaG [Candidatus Thermoplasmatota archaeon]
MNVDPNLTKYLIKVRITADGVVEKPDVVGAIFGQTEGLLGEELDLRDLQKGGRIGRIEVEIDSKKGKTEGFVLIPSGLDQVESSILAAALETIDRIGPCKAKMDVESVEDVRVQKRQKVIERAEALYKKMSQVGKNVSENIVQAVREDVERAEITSYGDEKLPAGPAIKDSDSIIVVEGRNDVLNLLKYGIKNTIAVQGTNIPKTVQDLSRERTVVVFLDGDRGGDLILKEMLQVADVDFVARAPPGTEVEELTYKQIVKALRYKMPIAQYLSVRGMSEELKELNQKNESEKTGSTKKVVIERSMDIEEDVALEESPHPEEPAARKPARAREEAVETKQEANGSHENDKIDLQNYKFIEGRAEHLLKEKLLEVYSEDGKVVASIPLAEAVDKLNGVNDGQTIISGGVISQRLIDAALNAGIKNVYGVRLGHVTKKPAEMRVITWDRRF